MNSLAYVTIISWNCAQIEISFLRTFCLMVKTIFTLINCRKIIIMLKTNAYICFYDAFRESHVFFILINVLCFIVRNAYYLIIRFRTSFTFELSSWSFLVESADPTLVQREYRCLLLALVLGDFLTM